MIYYQIGDRCGVDETKSLALRKKQSHEVWLFFLYYSFFNIHHSIFILYATFLNEEINNEAASLMNNE